MPTGGLVISLNDLSKVNNLEWQLWMKKYKSVCCMVVFKKEGK
jgi:hypothetical protein